MVLQGVSLKTMIFRIYPLIYCIIQDYFYYSVKSLLEKLENFSKIAKTLKNQ